MDIKNGTQPRAVTLTCILVEATSYFKLLANHDEQAKLEKCKSY